MENLPIDMSHPAIRDYLSLVRLQVLTPLSLLINMATVLVCTVAIDPSIGGISKLFPTVISPRPSIIAAYVILIYIGQIGYCVLLVFAKKIETKNTLIKGCGLALVFANWAMAFWAIAWVLKFFLIATILQGVLLALLVYSNIVLLIYHAPTHKRPLDMALIHAPMRFFLILPMFILFPYCLFVTLGMYYRPVSPDYDEYQWAGFGVVFGTNLLTLVVIVLRRDVVLTIAATWIAISLWNQRPKPVSVSITAILFTVLHPLGLITSSVWNKFFPRQQGTIALPPDHPDSIHGTRPNGQHAPREVDAEALWGDN